MNDAELRGRLLKTFYDLRHNAQGWVPTSDMNLGGAEHGDRQKIGGVCQQLADANLIRWKPLIGAQEGFIIGMAQITAFGVDVVEGTVSPPIRIAFGSAGVVAATSGKTSSQEEIGVKKQNVSRAVVLTALGIETGAVLRHLTSIFEEEVRGTVFHVGEFEGWQIAVAECGEGNVSAAATIDRGIGHFKPSLAMFVGVAGGIKDVVIGDVIVASKVYGYERGKDTKGGFEVRPNLSLPAYGLEQRARAIRQRVVWQRHLQQGLGHVSPSVHIGPIAAGEKVIASSRGGHRLIPP
jgi:nucleoside phosphorylase